jgi:7-cyano-7-deazaguanine synthase
MKTLKDVKKVVVSLSGGLDSTTLLYLAVKELGADNVFALSMSYGQRHSVELECAKRSCDKLGVYHKIIDISFLGEITKNVSAMVSDIVATPEVDDLEAGKQVPTYVPFRNTILSGIVLAFAEAHGADGVALGVQYGDYENSESYFYWDCSKAFTEAMQAIANLNDKHKISYVTPFVNLTKKDEIKLGTELGVDYGNTWTCYNPRTHKIESWEYEPAGGRNQVLKTLYIACGVCPSCAGRASAFKELGLEDPYVKNGVLV